MKKLLSAVTSFVMGASLMTSAFASSVSAAGSVSAVQPNVSIGEVNNVSANRSAAVSNGDIVLDFGNYEAEKGGKVNVNVTLKKGADCEVGSYDVKFKLDSPLTITAFGSSSAAYGSAAVESNKETLQASFICLDTNSDPVKGSEGEVVFKFAVSIPDTCADGIYSVGLASAEIFKGGKNSDKWSYSVEGGTIKVGNPVDTTTTTTTTVTTSTTTSKINTDADIVLDFGKYEGEKGGKVNVNVVLQKGADKEVGSYDVKFKLDSPLSITAFGSSSAAYGNSAVESNKDTLQASFICLDTNSDPVKGSEGDTVFKFAVSIPDTCADGVYTVDFASAEIFKGGKNSDKWTYATIPGTITVGKPVSTTSTTTSTTSTSIVENGEIVFDFGNYEANAGEKVTVNAVLKDGGDKALASMDVKFKLDSPLTIAAFGSSSPAYNNAAVESNKETLQASFMCMDTSADPIKGTEGETIFKFSVQIPEGTADGVYKVGIASAEIFKQGENSDKWSYSVVNGNIKVGNVTTTSTTTTVTTTSTVTTSTTVPPIEGSVEWVIPTVNAEPGDTVTMNVLVKNSDLEVAGAQYIIKAASPIVYSSASGSDAYKSDIEANDKSQEFAFGEKIGAGVKAANDSKVMVLTYKVPADCADGTYPVKWSDAFISDTNGADITSKVKLTDGAIVVEKPVDGQIKWVLDNVKAKPGETVTLKAVVSDLNNAAVSVAGAQFLIKADSPIAYSAIEGTDAYDAEFEANNATQEFAFANEFGEGVVAANGNTVLTLTYKVPADCAPGTYDVKWSDAFISDTNGKSITANVKLVDGSITVVDNEYGTVEWIIPEKDAEPGGTVTMEVVVKNGTDPLTVAGAQFIIKAADPIEYASATGSAGYKADLEANGKTQEFAFAEANGANVTAADNSTVIVLTYKVPEDCADGIYPVKWSDQFVSAEGGDDVTANVKFTDGYIRVKVPTTTVSTTTDTTTTIDTSTSTTSTDTTTTTDTTTSTDTTTTTTDTTTTSSTTTSFVTIITVTIPEGSIGWIVDTVEAEPGETVALNVKVYDPNDTKLPIGGAQYKIDQTAPIEYVGATDTSIAYLSTIEGNNTTKEFAFASADGSAKIGVDGAVVMTLTYKVPDDCAAGLYTVEFDKSFYFISSADGLDMTDHIIPINGAILVKVPTTSTSSTTSTTDTTTTDTTTTIDTSTTTTTTDTTTTITSTTIDTSTSTTSTDTTTTIDTTTSTDTTTTTTDTTSTTSTTTVTVPDGSIGWIIDTVEAEPGDNVALNIKVYDPNAVKLPIGGAQYKINQSDVIGYTGASEASMAYLSSIEGNNTLLEFAFASADGSARVGADGAIIMTLNYTIPADCPGGTYPVKFDKDFFFVSSADGANMTSQVLTFDGAIIVKVPTTSTSSTTTTTDTTTTDTTTTIDTTTSTTSTDTTTTSTSTTSTDTTTTIDTTTSTTSTDTDTTTTSTSTSTSTTTTTTTTTTTSTTSTTSTTLPPLPDGAVIWAGETVEGMPGETVELSFNILDPNSSKLPISGAQFLVKVENGENFVISGASGSEAYGAEIEPQNKTGEYAFANGIGSAVASEDGKSVIKLSIVIPEDATPGEYVVDMYDHIVTDVNGSYITDKVLVLDGKIIVGDPTPERVSSYAVIETEPGFYFSHDDGTNGRGFSKDMVKTIKIVDVYSNGTEVERTDVDASLINFNGKTPASVYDATRTDFKYDHDVQVYYGDLALTDKDGNPLYITAYIGVKGDINLDNKVTAVDASAALIYNADLQLEGNTPDTLQLSFSPLVKAPGDVYDQFAAFLGDVDEDEFAADNWKKTKSERKIIPIDASKILVYYAELQNLIAQYGENVPAASQQELWDKICPSRNTSK